jgi:hypothetical protein
VSGGDQWRVRQKVFEGFRGNWVCAERQRIRCDWGGGSDVTGAWGCTYSEGKKLKATQVERKRAVVVALWEFYRPFCRC